MYRSIQHAMQYAQRCRMAKKKLYSLHSETWTTEAVWRRAFYFHKILLRWNCIRARRRIAGNQQMCSIHCANAIVSVLYAHSITWVNIYWSMAKSGRKLNLFDKFMSVETSTWADTRQCWGKCIKYFVEKQIEWRVFSSAIYSRTENGKLPLDLYTRHLYLMGSFDCIQCLCQ